MTWNHRVIRAEHDGEFHYAVHECYYSAPGDDLPHSWTMEPIPVVADTREGLSWVLARMAEAVAKPVLSVVGGKVVEVEAEAEMESKQ